MTFEVTLPYIGGISALSLLYMGAGQIGLRLLEKRSTLAILYPCLCATMKVCHRESKKRKLLKPLPPSIKLEINNHCKKLI